MLIVWRGVPSKLLIVDKKLLEIDFIFLCQLPTAWACKQPPLLSSAVYKTLLPSRKIFCFECVSTRLIISGFFSSNCLIYSNIIALLFSLYMLLTLQDATVIKWFFSGFMISFLSLSFGSSKLITLFWVL